MTVPSVQRDAKDLHALVEDIVSQLSAPQPSSRQIIELAQRTTKLGATFLHHWGRAPTSETADLLDEAGTRLWNHTIQLQKSSHESADKGSAVHIKGLVRGAAALLTYASTPKNDDVEDNARLLSVLSRAVSAMCAPGSVPTDSHENADELLSGAAEIYEVLRKCPAYAEQANALEATQVFCLAKHQLAILDSNLVVAEYALETALSEIEQHGLSLRMVLRVVKVCIDHGSSLLTQRAQVPAAEERSRLLDAAVRWLRRSITVLEKVENGMLPQVQEMQVQALNNLASAYFEHAINTTTLDEASRLENLTRAETTLSELLSILRQYGSSIEDAPSITLLRLEILALRNAPTKSLLDLIRFLCQSATPFSANSISRIMTVLRSRDESFEFVEQAVSLILTKLLEAPEQPDELIHIVLHSTLALCKATPMLSVAYSMLDRLSRACFYAIKDASFAAQLTLWKVAESYEARDSDRLIAATFYRLASHKVFSAAVANVARSVRKAASCHIEAGQLAAAREILLDLPTPYNDHASAHYLSFVTHAREGHEADALTSLNALLACPDFESQMLTPIVKLAQDVGLESVLYQAMRGLSERSRVDGNFKQLVDPVVLSRCLVKHALPPSSPGEMTSFTQDQAATLISHLDNLLHALRNSNKEDPKACEEAEWAYKASYNAAISVSQHLRGVEWETSAQLFDIVLAMCMVRESFVDFPVGAGVSAEAATAAGARSAMLDYRKCKVWVKLSSIVARASTAREAQQSVRDGGDVGIGGKDQARRIMWFKIKDEVDEGFALLNEVRNHASAPTDDVSAAEQTLPSSSPALLREVEWALLLLQWEATIKLRDWAAAQRVFSDRVVSSVAQAQGLAQAMLAAAAAGVPAPQQQPLIPVRIFETMADLLMGDPQAPPELVEDVQLGTIETIKGHMTLTTVQADGEQDQRVIYSSGIDVPRLATWVRLHVLLHLNKVITNSKVHHHNPTGPARNSSGVGATSHRSRQEAALRHIQAGVETLSLFQGKEWPADEQRWILAVAWDMGVELFHYADYALSRPFCQAALDAARHLAAEGHSVDVLDRLDVQFKSLVAKMERHPMDRVGESSFDGSSHTAREARRESLASRGSY